MGSPDSNHQDFKMSEKNLAMSNSLQGFLF
jgi:hypothetical protein